MVENKKLITLDDILEKDLQRRSFIVSAASLLAGGLILPSTCFAKTNTALSAVRVGKKSNGARFVIDLSNDVNYTVFTLANPYRVVIDLPNVENKISNYRYKDSNPFVKNVRFGKSSAGNLRIVIDLSKAANAKKVFSLPPQSNFGWRLVVDMLQTSHANFMANIGLKNSIAKNSKLASSRKSKIIKPEPKKLITKKEKKIIVLDAGHGGKDPGAIGCSGVYEKNITLAMAKELRRQLVRTGKFDVKLTRDRDVSVALRSRVRRARKYEGDLFVSLHADSNKNRSVKGLSVYTLSENSSDREAAALAERENKADIIAGLNLDNEAPEVAGILIDLAQRETMNLSAEFASTMVKEMVKSVKLLRNTHRFAGFAVLKAPDIPSVLLEMGYLSNKYEERQLRQKSYRAKLARAATKSIERFFNYS